MKGKNLLKMLLKKILLFILFKKNIKIENKNITKQTLISWNKTTRLEWDSHLS